MLVFRRMWGRRWWPKNIHGKRSYHQSSDVPVLDPYTRMHNTCTRARTHIADRHTRRPIGTEYFATNPSISRR
jgi:hypothetical protein